ncbi:penicillin-binding transpeptidase domain-containing protein [Pseudonocardia sp. ICBG601]|uniref:penicillin-binding transpeptidase domain-containing protein n=1 Tax=Pseudonocardia sp. ICBG601 TaxID=2846759 RepID=UPI0027E347E4|nr:penicillin-binding transpeptidase domain-containing protein [Pseudonocardia sp. ICBG601]
MLAKSSNVGTLMTAQKVGEDRFSDMLAKMGIGQKTGVGLPGESPARAVGGSQPARPGPARPSATCRSGRGCR